MVEECDREGNCEKCNCTYPGCPRKGKCCECIRYHLENKQLPACCFPEDVEAGFDRSFDMFCQIHMK